MMSIERYAGQSTIAFMTSLKRNVAFNPSEIKHLSVLLTQERIPKNLKLETKFQTIKLSISSNGNLKHPQFYHENDILPRHIYDMLGHLTQLGASLTANQGVAGLSSGPASYFYGDLS